MATMWEGVYRSQVQRAREEQDNSLACRRGNYELRRDIVVEGSLIAFAVLLLIGIALTLVFQPALIPGTALCSALIWAFRSLLARREPSRASLELPRQGRRIVEDVQFQRVDADRTETGG